ncbi:unnamed protein product, partial [Symbiodinium microadriaticum]
MGLDGPVGSAVSSREIRHLALRALCLRDTTHSEGREASVNVKGSPPAEPKEERCLALDPLDTLSHLRINYQSQKGRVTGHWHLFRANGRSPSSHQQGAQHCSCEVHELAVALPGAGEKPTITGCRCNGSPHGKPLTCLKNCLHSPHPDGFVMEGVHQSTTADCNEPPFSFPGCYGHGHVCIGNAFAALGFLAHLMPLRQVSIWIPRTRPECVAQSAGVHPKTEEVAVAGELPDCKRKAAELELFMEDLLASSDATIHGTFLLEVWSEFGLAWERGPPRCSKAVHLGDGSRAQRLATRVLNAPEHLRLAPGIKDSEGYEPRCCFQGSLCFKAGSCLPRRDGPSRQQFFAVGRHRADAHHNVTRPGRQTGAAHRKGPWGASEPIVECTGAHGWRHEAATPQSSMALERWLWPVTETKAAVEEGPKSEPPSRPAYAAARCGAGNRALPGNPTEFENFVAPGGSSRQFAAPSRASWKAEASVDALRRSEFEVGDLQGRLAFTCDNAGFLRLDRGQKAGVAFESKAECLQDDIADDAIPEGALNYELRLHQGQGCQE